MPKIVVSSKKKDASNGIHENEAETKCELKIYAEENVSTAKGLYILGLCGTENEADFRIAATFSDYSCAVYSVGERLARIISMDRNESPVVGSKFSSTSKHILYTATRDGIINACDLRAKGKVIATVRDSTPDGKLRPFASFDISSDDRLVVAGSEHVGGDAFILFWDLRYNSSKTEGKSDLLGGYWESHMDDVTALAFNPTEKDILGSGSTDGLINVFDLTKSNEDSALKYSLNTESSVDRLGWLNNGNVWCTTHTHELQLWDCEDAGPYGKFDRKAVGSLMESDADTSYVVRMHNTNAFGQPFLLAGSTSSKSELSGLCVTDDNLRICYSLNGNKQLVRDSWYNEKIDCLITGGEMGIIDLWKRNDAASLIGANQTLTKFGGKTREKQPRAKPY